MRVIPTYIRTKAPDEDEDVLILHPLFWQLECLARTGGLRWVLRLLLLPQVAASIYLWIFFPALHARSILAALAVIIGIQGVGVLCTVIGEQGENRP